jgi:hypothetical protein
MALVPGDDGGLQFGTSVDDLDGFRDDCFARSRIEQGGGVYNLQFPLW